MLVRGALCRAWRAVSSCAGSCAPGCKRSFPPRKTSSRTVRRKVLTSRSHACCAPVVCQLIRRSLTQLIPSREKVASSSPLSQRCASLQLSRGRQGVGQLVTTVMLALTSRAACALLCASGSTGGTAEGTLPRRSVQGPQLACCSHGVQLVPGADGQGVGPGACAAGPTLGGGTRGGPSAKAAGPNTGCAGTRGAGRVQQRHPSRGALCILHIPCPPAAHRKGERRGRAVLDHPGAQGHAADQGPPPGEEHHVLRASWES